MPIVVSLLYVCILPSAFPKELVAKQEKWASSFFSHLLTVRYSTLSYGLTRSSLTLYLGLYEKREHLGPIRLMSLRIRRHLSNSISVSSFIQ